MPDGIQNVPAWQLEFKPHEWLEILQTAMHDLKLNPNNQEALQAIDYANQALSAYDEAEAVGGSERLQSGIQGGVGVLESGLNALKGIIGLPGAAYRATRAVVKDPEKAANDLNAIVENIGGRVSEAAAHPVRTLEEATPRDIGKGAGDIGLLLAPFAKTAGSFTRVAPLAKGMQGPLTAMEASPTAGEVLARAVASPFRRVGSTISNWMQKPEVQNAMNRAKMTQAEEAANLSRARVANTVRQGEMQEQLFPERLQQAQLKTQITGETYGRQAGMADQLNDRIKLLEQALERGDPTLENLNLRNELLKLRLQQASNAGGIDASEMGGTGLDAPPSTPKPKINGPKKPIAGATGANTGNQYGYTAKGPENLRPMTPADEAFSATRSGVQTGPGDATAHAGGVDIEEALNQAKPKVRTPKPKAAPTTPPPFEEDLNIARKSKWPNASTPEIEQYLRNIAQYLQQGY